MKKTTAIILAAILLSASCSEEKKKDKLSAELKTKKEAFENLRREITDLQMQLDKLDTAGSDKGKPVNVMPLVYTRFTHSIDIQGRVDADESVSVGPQIPGLVTRVYVHAGDKVAAGQVMAETDNAAMVQQLAALQAQRDLAKDVYTRQQNLWAQKIGTEIQLLQSKTQYEALDKQVSAMQEQVDMTRIKAPIAGIVDQVNMKTGEMAAIGFSNIVLVNTNSLRVKAEVAEGYLSQVHTGNVVNIYFPDANKTIEAKISYSGRMINKVNRTFNVEAVIDPNEPDIVPNMIAVLKINDYSNDSALVAPLSCIQESSGGKHFVFIAVKNKEGQMIAEKREVTYAHTYNGMAEITGGLSLNDMLITDGSGDLNAGDMIDVKK
ncbi:MAG TPA: efflux RND transporter periplasmic adaptor subunit [Bacteroidia bacterium]|nr:efflux RND transporter periplasmic adaptor subunit [Bacteroidia bacterium]